MKAAGSRSRFIRIAVAGVLLAACCPKVRSQFYLEPLKEPVAVPQPVQLFQDLTACNSFSRSCEEGSEEKQAAALAALGIPTKSAEGARLLFEDLDGDQKAEALLTVDIDTSDVILVVLKQKGSQWYRLSPNEAFSCWCKYESDPLDSFVEVVQWNGSFDKAGQPRRLILVRGSWGGTGLYERGLAIFALDGDRIRPIFDATEERRECSWPEGNCRLDHVLTTFEFRLKKDNVAEHVLVTHTIHLTRHENDNLNDDESWWLGIPSSSCKVYEWDSKAFKFVENGAANVLYCRSEKRKAADR